MKKGVELVITPRQSISPSAVKLTDADFTDDIALTF